ncbi:hypothetical protein H257_03465 [Aphanomyces astaci]|uniref:Methyltransferase type 11 domain-containing protein n=1 Tax=Aphanomyces astaci TaxID=112090 RepID=W4GYU4_APHAT|nr:hypothetical protein H257_03465 [Aphanomyces astaci]ETV84179.1 hypothetical protein H257_03465 [Aphanomyces astaci]|eukprot:XP_009825871.1 hypothetical protein H257_03465 [Aphanomyces astaci]
MTTPPLDVITDLRVKWNAFSADYTEVFNKSISIQSARELHRHLDLDTATSVLEVGAGAGLGSLDALRYLESSGLGTKYILSDLSPSMLDLAKQNILASKCTIPIDVVEANAQDLKLPDASVDRYISTLVLQLVPDPNAMLRESHRVLGSGGVAGFVIWGQVEHTAFFRLLAAANDKLGVPSGFTSNYALGRDLPTLRAKLRTAGFSSACVWLYLAVAEKWEAEKYATLAGRLFPVDDEAFHLRRHTVLVELAAAWLATGQPIGMETYLVVAKK